MTLEDLGYTPQLEQYRKDQNLESFLVGRVITEHKDRFIVKTDTKEFDAEIIGKLRFSAESRQDLPAVGDWVAFTEYDEAKGLIHAIYPRHSIIERQAVGKAGQKQIIATNIDVGLIVQSINRDFNINRLERYLTICNASKVAPIILLSKIDLIEETTLDAILDQIKERIPAVPIIPISSPTNIGMDQLAKLIKKGKTYCLLGSSGVGKSTLLNKISGKDLMHTGAINQSIDRGKHITSHRELIVLGNGGILIDNPGMREVGITDASIGLELTFDKFVQLALECKFKDCTHINETGCAILAAVDTGSIEESAYQNFQKMVRERARFESSVAEKRKKDKKLGKLYKTIIKRKKREKF